MSTLATAASAGAAPSPVLIVGTGRCGSTLLSDMIRDHEAALSISELFSFVTDFGMRIEQAFPAAPICGREFWALLSVPQPRQSMLLRHGLQMPEVIYPWSSGAYTPEQGLPPIMQALIPHLAPDEPDALFDDIGASLARRPIAPIADHYRALFAELQQRLGKRFWVERSGGSLRLSKRLLTTFPEARVLHLVRDGRDTALSMSRHIGFRMALLCGLQAELLGVDPYESCDRSEEEDLSPDLADALPETFSREAFDAVDLPASLCGHYWSGEIVEGLAELAQLPPERRLTIRYEDLLEKPTETIMRVGRFLDSGRETTEGICPAWVERSVGRVEPRAPRWLALSEEGQNELAMACRPGFEALADVGLTWS